MVFGGGTFRRSLGYEGGALVNGVSDPYKREPGELPAASTLGGHSENTAV